MVPATDRSRSLLPRTNPTSTLALLGFALVPFAVAPGCAKMRTFRATPTSAVLGVERPDNNFSSYHTSRNLQPSANGDDLGAAGLPHLAGVDVLPPGAMIASDPVAQPTATTTTTPTQVTNQPPMMDEIQPASIPEAGPTHLVSATQGVPDAARLLAGGSSTKSETVSHDPAAIVAESRTAVERLSAYQATLHRQERVGNNLLPAEDLVLSIRRQPRAVRLSWPSGPNQGREAIYRSDAADGLMHVHMGKGSIVPRMNLAPDSPLVMRNSRHPITEAGFEPILADLERAAQTPGSTLAAIAPSTPAPLDRPHVGVARTNPAGEVAVVYFDPDTHLPALVEVKTGGGDLLEHYVFRDIQTDPAELLSASAFDPDERWGKPRGLFGGRVARGGGADADLNPPR